MKKFFLLVMIQFLSYCGFAQYHYEFGYWENNSWKKLLKTPLDSNGAFTIKYPGGAARYLGAFKDGLPAGAWKFYSPTGSLQRESNYNGDFIEYGWQGEKIIKGKYSNGIPVGAWSHYEYNYYDPCNDTGIVYQSYDCTTDTITKYFYMYYNQMRNPCKDTTQIKPPTTTKIKSRHRYFMNHLEPTFMYSYDVGAGIKVIDFTKINNLFEKNLNQKFEMTPLFFCFGFTSGKPNKHIFYFNYYSSEADSLKTDSINYRLRGGAGVAISFGYDVIKANMIDLVPYAGIGTQHVKLTYHEIEQDTLVVNNLFTNIPNSNSSDQMKIDYKSRNFIIDIGIDLRMKVSFSKYINSGIYLGGKYGYMYSPSSGNWTYSINSSSNRQNADFIPNTTVSGSYWLISLGYFFIL